MIPVILKDDLAVLYLTKVTNIGALPDSKPPVWWVGQWWPTVADGHYPRCAIWAVLYVFHVDFQNNAFVFKNTL